MNSEHTDLITYLENNYQIENLKNYLSNKRNILSWSISNSSLEKYIDSFEFYKIQSLNAIKKLDYRFVPFRIKKIPNGKGKCRKVGVVNIYDIYLCRLIYNYLQLISGNRNHCNIHSISLNIKDKIRNGYEYFIRADIKNFFESLDHQIIINIISSYKDVHLTTLIRNFIRTPWIWTKKYDTILAVPEENENGVLPGSSISQGISEIYLQDFDSKIKNHAFNHSDYYTRYCDDICYLSKSKYSLDKAKAIIEKELSYIKLSLNSDKLKFGDINIGFDYLGFHHNSDGIKISHDSLIKIKRSIIQCYKRTYSKAKNERFNYRRDNEEGIKNWELLMEKMNSIIRGFSKAWSMDKVSFEKVYGLARYMCIIDNFEQIKKIDCWIGKLNKYYCYKICELEDLPKYYIELDSILNWYFRYKKDLKKTILLAYSKHKSYDKILTEINLLFPKDQELLPKEDNSFEDINLRRTIGEHDVRDPDSDLIDDDLDTSLIIDDYLDRFLRDFNNS